MSAFDPKRPVVWARNDPERRSLQRKKPGGATPVRTLFARIMTT